MEKFDHLKHQSLLLDAIEEDGRVPVFVLNPLWLSKGPYFIDQDENYIYIYKKSKIYNNEVFYHVGAPIIKDRKKSGKFNDSRDKIRGMLSEGIDFLLTDQEIYHHNLTVEEKPEKSVEFVYHSETYEDLKGKNWASWRQSLKKVDEILEVKYYPTNKIPFTLKPQLESILKEWKKYREKYIGKHSTWYMNHCNELKDAMVMVFYYKGKPISYNVSQLCGDTIFFLDEKTIMGVLPNSFTISKAYHILCMRWWLDKESENTDELFMTSGLGEGKYVHNGKEFDLDKHKHLLKPYRLIKFYKVRGKK